MSICSGCGKLIDNKFYYCPWCGYSRVQKETEDSTSGIIGFYHSHPDKEAVLSMADKRGMIPGQLYVLVSVCSSGCRNITAWCRTDETIKEAELNTPLFAR